MKAGNGLDKVFFMKEAIRLATENMLAGEGGPFGAVIVQQNTIIARGWNRVTSTNDPTAHAEVDCIRKACSHLKSFDLSGCVLYANCEPCPMCLSAAYWANITQIFYGADQQDAARAGFNDRFIYEELNQTMEKRKMVMEQLLHKKALETFALWDAMEEKIRY